MHCIKITNFCVTKLFKMFIVDSNSSLFYNLPFVNNVILSIRKSITKSNNRYLKLGKLKKPYG